MDPLASIGYNGQPVRSPFRVVRPPIAVLVDLTVLFPRQPHRSGRYQPNGLQLHKVVEGRLSCWALCEQGDLVGPGHLSGGLRRQMPDRDALGAGLDAAPQGLTAQPCAGVAPMR